MIEKFQNLSEEWMIFLAGMLGTFLGFLGRRFYKFLFPGHRPKVRAVFEQLPMRPTKPAPEGQPSWEHFDDGARNAIIRLENIGTSSATLRTVEFQVGKRAAEVLVGVIHESGHKDCRFEAYQIEMNSFCTFQAKVPEIALLANSQILFHFSGMEKAITLKIPRSHKTQPLNPSQS